MEVYSPQERKANISQWVAKGELKVIRSPDGTVVGVLGDAKLNRPLLGIKVANRVMSEDTSRQWLADYDIGGLALVVSTKSLKKLLGAEFTDMFKDAQLVPAVSQNAYEHLENGLRQKSFLERESMRAGKGSIIRI